MRSSLRAEAEAACGAALGRLGFVGRQGSLLQPRGGGASGWIGLNLATYDLPDALHVNPVVGVCFSEVEEISRALQDDLPPKVALPVVASPLGYLMPEKSFRMWDFPNGGDIAQVAESLAGAVEEYGMPYVERYSDWKTLRRDVEAEDMLLEHERAKTLPVVLAVNEEFDRARAIVRDELDRVSGSDDVYARSYREFAQRFADRFGAAS